MPLREPGNWRERDLTVALGLLLFGASGVVGAFWTIGAVRHGDFLTAVITAGGTVFAFGFCAIAGVGRFRRVALRGTVDANGTVLRPDPLGTWLICITFAAVVPSGVLYVIFVPQGVVDMPLSRGEQIFTPILIGFLVAIAAGGLVAYARRGPGHLLLSPQGFEIRELVSTKRGSWSDVTDVTDNAPQVRARHPIAILMKDGQPHIIQGASGYAPNGAALYWMILAEPGRIRELVTGAGFCDPELEGVTLEFSYRDFDDFWDFLVRLAGALAVVINPLPDDERAATRAAMIDNAEPYRNEDGSYTFPASAWCVLAR